MNGKRSYASPQSSPEKPPGKRRCLDGSTLPDPGGVDSSPANEADAHHDSPPDNDPEIQNTSRSAVHLDCLDHGTEYSPEACTSQALVLIEKPPILDREDRLAETTSALVKVRAAGTLLTDWPAYSPGLTEGICDLQTLKRFMTSDLVSDDHKAMWVSLVQTIVHEPDPKLVLLCLQNLLSGDFTFSDSLVNHPHAIRRDNITQQQWAVTGSIRLYAREKTAWSAAHFVDLALRVGGPDAGIQAARALKIFGVWNPSGRFESFFSRSSIRNCLDHKIVLRKIWPSEDDGHELIPWANFYQASTGPPFVKFKDAHLYLLRQCVGEDLQRFARLSRDAARTGGVGNRIISRAYFDSTLAPLLVEHFDADVDLELAYSAAVANQGQSVDRRPIKRVAALDVPQPQSVLSGNADRHQGYCKNVDGKTKQMTFYEAENDGDDSEPDDPRTARDIKSEPGVEQDTPPSYKNKTQYRRVPTLRRIIRRWTNEEERVCIRFIMQIVRRVRDKELNEREYQIVSERMKAEHNFDRVSTSIRTKWRTQWSHRPEYRNLQWANDKDDKAKPNKDKRRYQKALSSEEEEEEEAEGYSSHSNTGSEDSLSESPAEEDATDQEAVHKSPPRAKPHTEQVSSTPRSTLRVTRGMLRSQAIDNKTINNLYQRSRSLSSNVIARFLATDRSNFYNSWKKVLEHRTVNGMDASGSEDNPPFPSDEASDELPTSESPRDLLERTAATAQSMIDKTRVQNFEEEIKRIKKFAESVRDKGRHQQDETADESV